MTITKRSLWKRVSTRRQEDAGATAVEFALVLPLLLTFLIGIVTYGYIMAFQQSVTEAAAEGARTAAIAPVDKSNTDRATDAKATISRVMDSYGVSCGSDGLSCTVTMAPCEGDILRTCATVAVSYDWKNHPRIPTMPLLPAPEKLERTTVIEVS